MAFEPSKLKSLSRAGSLVWFGDVFEYFFLFFGLAMMMHYFRNVLYVLEIGVGLLAVVEVVEFFEFDFGAGLGEYLVEDVGGCGF